MKHLKTYRIFESQGRKELTEEQKDFLTKNTLGTWSLNPTTGLVDVKGDFHCSGEELEDFKGVKFGKVTGYFNCDDNKLTSLAGGPKEVGKSFWCSYNKLTSLEGAPQKVGGNFACVANKLTSLAGAPQEVGGDFSCYDNKLTSLEGAPQKVGREFFCNAFELKHGKWNLEGWLKVLREGSPEAQSLIRTILSAEALNKEIARDPAGMIMKLKDIWNDDDFKETRGKLVWPKGYGDVADLVGDLGGIGL